MSYVVNINPEIAQQPTSATAGTTLVQWGTGFTPNSTAVLHFRKPDGTEYPTLNQPIDGIGHFETSYVINSGHQHGTYIWWGFDGPTGARSNNVSYIVY